MYRLNVLLQITRSSDNIITFFTGLTCISFFSQFLLFQSLFFREKGIYFNLDNFTWKIKKRINKISNTSKAYFLLNFFLNPKIKGTVVVNSSEGHVWFTTVPLKLNLIFNMEGNGCYENTSTWKRPTTKMPQKRTNQSNLIPK